MKKNKPSRTEKLQHLDAALGHVSNFRTAIDAGAHVGKWSLVMAKRFKRVVAFEPMASNQAKWRSNLAGFDNAELVCAALGNVAENVRMDGEGHSKHFAVSDPHGPVKRLRIDDFDISDLDFMKVDCEGADALVLIGAERTLLRNRPVVIVESLPWMEERLGLSPGAPLAYLESLGFKRVAEMWCDYIYVP